MRISGCSSDVCSSDRSALRSRTRLWGLWLPRNLCGECRRHHRPQTDRADRRDRLACAHRAADEGQVVKAIALALLLTFSAAAAAAATAYAVATSTTELTPTQQEPYEALTHELRCLVCQNETNADRAEANTPEHK